jgi:aryl-alcohol dehydrogenase-like predicted oxidoreductase
MESATDSPVGKKGGVRMVSRRNILKVLGTLPAAGYLATSRTAWAEAPRPKLPQRLLGRTGRWVTPLALGGQASLQWTAPGIDAPDIIVRAVQLGVNYLDSANVYGPSQMNYGEAFRRLHLVPGTPEYNAPLRASLYIASKTRERYGLGPSSQAATAPGATAVSDLRRTLTQMFGDGKGYIPEGAYIDAIQMHALQGMEEADQLYEGMAERGGKMPDRIGAIAAMLDYRDGTNYTGLNPERRQWVRHIGVTGHFSSPMLMEVLRRDTGDNIDTLLVALNANDKLYTSHEYNVLQLAVARGMGVIAMKVFADGVFYGKEPHFSRVPEDVIRSVGKPDKISHEDLVRYTLSIPGVSCAVTGIGQIDRAKPENDQLVTNLASATQDPASAELRRKIENEMAQRYGATTNYFQLKQAGLVQPTEVKIEKAAGSDQVTVRWNTAIAAAKPITAYEIKSNDRLLLSLPYRPQLTTELLWASLPAAVVGDGKVTVIAREG